MLKTISAITLAILLPFVGMFGFLTEPAKMAASKDNSGTLEKMIVSSGKVSMTLDLNSLNGTRSLAKSVSLADLRFEAERDSFFTIVVFEDQLRGPIPGELPLTPIGKAEVPAVLNDSYERLVVEKTLPGEDYEFVVRDRKTWFPYFNVEGHEFSFDSRSDTFSLKDGRMLVTDRFAAEIGRPEVAGKSVGLLAISAKMTPIEVTELVNGEIVSNVMPALNVPEGTLVPGPDVVVGDVYGLAQFGSSGSQVGLAVGTNSCNYGEENLNWFALPNNDHPVIPQNLYRMSGGASNDLKFEQIGQSSVKHAFTALTQNLCGLGCNGVGGSRLGSGCSDPYSASLNAGPNLGSRAWINPFTGSYPRGDSATPPNNHSGHSHNGTSHRILTEMTDLRTGDNPGATYYAEGQYVTPHEYVWCQANPGECNMYNNVSYRQYTVSGNASSFTFNPAGSTVRTKPAIEAWPGATIIPIEPAPGVDGLAAIAYKVTQVSAGVWHYEYAVYNQSLDRAIQAFSVAIGAGAPISNVGFHAPPQHPGSSGDGTVGDAGFSSTPWASNVTGSEVAWSTETIGVNPNANAIRWGTMYNFRFESTSPPELKDATIGFFKTGSPVMAMVMAPGGPAVVSASVSGKVTDSSGRPIVRAWVVLMGSGGETYWTQSNLFGNYRMVGVPPATGYTIGASAKGYDFTPQMIDVNGNLTGVNIVASP